MERYLPANYSGKIGNEKKKNRENPRGKPIGQLVRLPFGKMGKKNGKIGRLPTLWAAYRHPSLEGMLLGGSGRGLDGPNGFQRPIIPRPC